MAFAELAVGVDNALLTQLPGGLSIFEVIAAFDFPNSLIYGVD